MITVFTPAHGCSCGRMQGHKCSQQQLQCGVYEGHTHIQRDRSSGMRTSLTSCTLSIWILMSFDSSFRSARTAAISLSMPCITDANLPCHNSYKAWVLVGCRAAGSGSAAGAWLLTHTFENPCRMAYPADRLWEHCCVLVRSAVRPAGCHAHLLLARGFLQVWQLLHLQPVRFKLAHLVPVAGQVQNFTSAPQLLRGSARAQLH